MGRRKEKLNLERILGIALEHGPKIVEELNIRLGLEDAEYLCRMLREQGKEAMPYDFPYTHGVWKSEDESGIPYKRHAMKEFIVGLSKEKKIDYTDKMGFRKLLKYINIPTIRERKTNRWGTSFHGMISHGYGNSPYDAIADLVGHDSDFSRTKEIGLSPYDLPKAPQNTWLNKWGRPTPTARAAVKELVKVVSKEKRLDYKRPEDFINLLPYLNEDAFNTKKISFWGTTLSIVLRNVYKSVPRLALRDMLARDPEFSDTVTYLRIILPNISGVLPRRTYYN